MKTKNLLLTHVNLLFKIHRMPGFTSLFTILISVPYIESFYGNDDFRSSYLSLWEDHVLLGHVMELHPVRGITSCAQDCLSKPECVSFNFGTVSNLCELNNSSSQFSKQELMRRSDFVHGHWITLPVVFTTLGAQGPTGPTSASGYLGTSLESQVQLKNGIQMWTVPNTGRYIIEAFGASGGNGTCNTCNTCPRWRLGGLGAKISGSFTLKRGQMLKILVGQKGKINSDFPPNSTGGGGGGTFVTLMDNSPLIVAGGGGGASGSTDGDPGQASQAGTRNGGKAGSGGKRSDPNQPFSGTGAGMWEDGVGQDGKALSFQHVQLGGYFADDRSPTGGFGGGGYALRFPGGGGGYSGGGVDAVSDNNGIAGGGGSINNGTSQMNESGVNDGDGKLIITLMN